MPIYEYLCKECNNNFSSLRRSAEDIAANCPKCGGQRVTRLLSVTARTSSAEPEFACGTGGCGMPMQGMCSRPGGCGCQ